MITDGNHDGWRQGSDTPNPSLPTTLRDLSSADGLLFASFGIWLALQILMRSLYAQYIDPYLIPLRALCLGLVVIGEISRGSKERHSLLAVSIAAVVLVSILSSTMNTMIDILAFVYCARKIPFRKLAYGSFLIIGVTTFFVCLSAYCGVIDNYIHDTPTRVRCYMGFRYALYPAQLVFILTCLAIYLSRNNLHASSVLGLVLLNCFVFFQTDSRLSFILSIAMIATSLFVEGVAKNLMRKKWIGVLVASSFIAGATASLWLTIVYDPSISILSSIDQEGLLGGRLRLGHAAIEEFGITLFGQRVDLVGNALTPDGVFDRVGDYNYVDSMYVQLLIRFGVIGFTAFVLFMTLVTWRAWRARNWGLVVALVFIAAHCVIDDLSLYLYFNPFLFLIGGLIGKPTKEVSSEAIDPTGVRDMLAKGEI